MDFSYLGYASDKKIVRGTVSAASDKIAGQMLAYQGYRVLSLKPASAFTPNWEKWFPSLFEIKPKEIIMFSRQMALLLESGTDIVTSLELLQTQVSSRSFKKILSEVISDLRNGDQLSAALSKHPKVFPSIYRRTLSVGERTGSMETVLRQVADYMEKSGNSNKKVKSALAYPLFVSITAVVVIGILVTFVLPVFVGLYSSMGAEVPRPTMILLSSVQVLRQYGLYLLTGLVVAIALVFAYIRTPAGRYRWDNLVLSLPLVGRVNLLNELASCCQNMALLVRAGLPLTEIMSLVIENCGNKAMVHALTGVQQSMLQGEGLSQPMARNPLFLPMMVQMIKVAEETGTIDATLSAVAQSYEIEADDKTRALIGLIQPTLTLTIGATVAFITISLMSAMYSVYGQMGG